MLLLEVPLCPSAAFLGIPCPGCGLTRATLALLGGDVTRALRFHPLVFLLAPLYFGLLAAAGVSYLRGTAPRSPSHPWLTSRSVTLLGWGVLALVLGVWVARFFGAFGGPAPVQPFSEFARRVHAK